MSQYQGIALLNLRRKPSASAGEMTGKLVILKSLPQSHLGNKRIGEKIGN